MSRAMPIRGLTETVAALNGALRDLVARPARRGLIAGGLIVQEEAMRRCPEDLGNLVGSAFAVWNGGERSSFRPRGKNEEVDEMLASSHASTLDTARAYLDPEDRGAFTRGTAIVIGFGAYYALYVHENVNGNVPRAGGKGEHHFLSNALLDKAQDVLAAAAGEVRTAIASAPRSRRRPR
jgi:hypothetical protein